MGVLGPVKFGPAGPTAYERAPSWKTSTDVAAVGTRKAAPVNVMTESTCGAGSRSPLNAEGVSPLPASNTTIGLNWPAAVGAFKATPPSNSNPNAWANAAAESEKGG